MDRRMHLRPSGENMDNIEPMSRILVTLNSEYGVRDNRVVAFRHRGERAWQRTNRAVGMKVVSDLRTLQVGETVMLAAGDDILTTSRLVGVRRGTVMSNAA